MKNRHRCLLVSSMVVLLAACNGGNNADESSVDTQNIVDGGVSAALKTTGGEEPEYIITQDNLSQGSVSAQGAGDEQLGWNFYYAVGNTLFVSGYQNYETLSYTVDENGDVSKLATFFFDWPLEAFGAVGEHTLLASDQPRDGSHTSRKLYTVDAATGLITEKTDYTIHDEDTGTPGEGTVAWATALKVRGEELYIPFHKLDDQGWYTTPDPDTAYVAIYDYPLESGAAPKTIISDDRTSNIGVNGGTTGLIEADSGDLYSFSNGSLAYGFSPASTKPSGILRIKSGETEFDADYFFNVEQATNGGKIAEFHYVGDNKALARIATDETNAFAWSAYYKEDPDWLTAASNYNYYNQKLVLIDLVNQTITDVANVPLHQKRYTSPVEVMDGKAYVSIETADDAYVYEVDIATATGTKGAKVEGKTVKGFFDLYN